MIVTCNGQENQMKAINDHEQPETIMKEQPETIMKEQLAYVDKTKNQLY
jgi:hypothetical protein